MKMDSLEKTTEQCPLCDGEEWRREWLIPGLTFVIALLMVGIGVVLLTFFSGRRRRLLSMWGVALIYVGVLFAGAAWKGRWRRCACAGGRRGYLYDD